MGINVILGLKYILHVFLNTAIAMVAGMVAGAVVGAVVAAVKRIDAPDRMRVIGRTALGFGTACAVLNVFSLVVGRVWHFAARWIRGG